MLKYLDVKWTDVSNDFEVHLKKKMDWWID